MLNSKKNASTLIKRLDSKQAEEEHYQEVMKKSCSGYKRKSISFALENIISYLNVSEQLNVLELLPFR